MKELRVHIGSLWQPHDHISNGHDRLHILAKVLGVCGTTLLLVPDVQALLLIHAGTDSMRASLSRKRMNVCSPLSFSAVWLADAENMKRLGRH